MEATFNKEEPNFTIGETICGYKLVQKIDEGGYGQVFKVARDEKFYAMKIELNSLEGGSAIKLEISVLTSLTSDVFPIFITGGKKIQFQYLVLELLGPNLKMLKAKSKGGLFSDGTWSRVGIQCLYALKVLHNAGFVHRDIKPSNFAIGMNTDNVVRSRRILLFDFGLARKFVNSEVVKVKKAVTNTEKTTGKKTKLIQGFFKPTSIINRSSETERTRDTDREVFTFRIARPNTDFRGTILYASPNAHLLIELGRQDDVWSLMFMIADLFCELPWGNSEEGVVEEMKQQASLARLFFDSKKPDRVTAEMNKLLEEIQNQLNGCDYYDHPNYDLVHKFLVFVMNNSSIQWTSPYDWEVADRISDENLTNLIRRASADGFPWETPGDFFKKDKWKAVKRPPKEINGSSDGVSKASQNKKSTDSKWKLKKTDKKKARDWKPSREERSVFTEKKAK